MSNPSRFFRHSLTAISVMAILLFSYSAAFAAVEKGNVEGAVVDASGSPIASAKVSLINAQQAIIGVVESDAEGRFRFDGAPVGTYLLFASKREFDDKRISVRISTNSTQNLKIVLSVGGFSDEITVSANTGQVEDASKISQQTNIISNEAIRERTTSVFAQVAAEEAGAMLQSTSPTIGGIYVRGLTGKNVSIYVDGVRYTTSAQRGGINTFLNLNEPSNLRAVEILRGPNSAQYGSDALGGSVQIVSRVPIFGNASEVHGDFNAFFNSAALSYGSNALVTYGRPSFGILFNLAGRRNNTLRPADGIDSHAAVTRFLGIKSDILGTRLPDTAFTQYAGTVHLNYAPATGSQFIFHYKRSQQDGGKRYDQLLGGDGNLVADLRNLMLDFGYLRFNRQGAGFFDNASFAFSFNSQREERVNQGGQGNPLASITSQFEVTRVYGFNFNLTKQTFDQNSVLFGGDVYRERVNAPAFTFNPVSAAARPSRPRVPDRSRYLSYGLYLQDVFDAIPNKLRFSGALRYGVASYKSRASNSPLVSGKPLFPDDSLRVDDFSGRIGVFYAPLNYFSVAFNYSRGFRAPNITDLGTLGLTGDGFEVASTDIAALGGTIGTTADDKAVSTGIPVSPQISETSDNYEATLRFNFSRAKTSLTGFIIDLNDTITKQSLILPQGAVGLMLGDQPIVNQLPNGVVFVPLSTAPALVRSNFTSARLFGFEYTLQVKFTDSVSFDGHFTYIRAKDIDTGLPPNIEGGTPAPNAFLSLRYAPPNKRYWFEVYSTVAADQERLSSLDLSDRRTGANRSRTSIASFFNNGARARGLTSPGADGIFGTPDDKLISTGETLAQIQNRVLGSRTSAPLFPALPGYGLVSLRGGVRINGNSELLIDFENIADKSYRSVSWGIDGPGRSITVQYKFRF